MREMVNMVVVLTVITAVSGGILSMLKAGTEYRIENQILKFQKAPAINAIFSDATNDPLKDRFSIQAGEREVTFFPGKLKDGSKAVAFETKGTGFGGDVGLMVGVNIDTDQIVKVRVTTHSETPGIGSRAKDSTDFVSQFSGMNVAKNAFKVKKDDGTISAMSGATVTSRGVCTAARKAKELYMDLKPKIKTRI
ncbi:MAG: RnfABCDGE type electron transport complex subunit G [Desulfarculaceae bacterium]|nr:RnfABCDGE type electron transport complex subunit G [Desulfarculaceae bacterium]